MVFKDKIKSIFLISQQNNDVVAKNATGPTFKSPIREPSTQSKDKN